LAGGQYGKRDEIIWRGGLNIAAGLP